MFNLSEIRKDIKSLQLGYTSKEQLNELEVYVNRELFDLKKEFRNQLEAEKRKFEETLNKVILNPPKYKKGDKVMFGNKKYTIYGLKIRDGIYTYCIYDRDSECRPFEFDIIEEVLYAKKKK
tara:strand:- start:276 stop:641 length:366 start_codon:yes stop_codon:yes gene_type:complete